MHSHREPVEHGVLLDLPFQRDTILFVLWIAGVLMDRTKRHEVQQSLKPKESHNTESGLCSYKAPLRKRSRMLAFAQRLTRTGDFKIVSGSTELAKLASTHNSDCAISTTQTSSSNMSAVSQNLEQSTGLLAERLNLAAENCAPIYDTKRDTLLKEEHRVRWDANAKASASSIENIAGQIIGKIRESERLDPELFGNLPGEALPDPKSRDMGGHFLSNKERIQRSRVFRIAQSMPKGAHLHLHFNSELPVNTLFPHARTLPENMFIRSTQPLLTHADYHAAEVVFSVLPDDTVRGDLQRQDYNPDWKSPNNSAWMRWSDFRKRFPEDLQFEEPPGEFGDLDLAERWAQSKMVINLSNAYRSEQTTNGAWACFNQGTRAFKGLVNYESVYRWYAGAIVDSMIRDKVMYAELRPMLLDKFIPSDDGKRQLDHKAQMAIICEEVKLRQRALEKEGKLDLFPFGVKIIYCTPRSIPRERMKKELEDCLKLKLQFPDLICGFDLVGAEDRPNHVGFYADLLVAFTETCTQLGIKIPFMFHAGETLIDTGGSQNPNNSNLYDSLLLNAKRIGHGYSILKHPVLVKKYIEQNICLELCPISNELLHLCANARQHIFPELLAAGLHCTLNADNPSLFRASSLDSSSLSHEFYQVMVGDPGMNIHGWKQLAEWSLEHSCISETEVKTALDIFHRDWAVFCDWIIKEFGDYANSLPDLK